MMVAVREIPVDCVVAGRNDRRVFDEERLSELASSIASNGLAQPITVRPHPERDDQFEVVAGERRWRAHRMLERECVPAIVRDMDDDEVLAVMLSENTSREDLDPIEEAWAYERRLDAGWTQKRIAETAGVSTGRVRARLNLLDLREEAQKLVQNGNLPLKFAEVMVDLDLNRQLYAIRFLRDSSGVTIDVFRAFVSDLLEEQAQDTMIDLADYYVERLEEEGPHHYNGLSADLSGVPDLPAGFPRPTRGRQGERGGEVMWRYVKKLQAAGHEREAQAVGTVLCYLVRRRLAGLPRRVIMERVPIQEEAESK